MRFIHSANGNSLPFILLKEYESEFLRRENFSDTQGIAVYIRYTCSIDYLMHNCIIMTR